MAGVGDGADPAQAKGVTGPWNARLRALHGDWSLSLDPVIAALAEQEWFGQARYRQYPTGQAAPQTWLVTGGRGAGKTRLGAEWVNGLVRGFVPFAELKYGHIALLGETLGDVREVMIDGVSGLVRTARYDAPRYEATRRRLLWSNGAVAQVFSSEDPESLRGPQFDAAWCDEVGKWKHAEACFDMLQFGLRLGRWPVQLLTTTPRPTRLLKRLVADKSVRRTTMTTADNAQVLARSFLQTIRNRYAGSLLGRQELDGELIEDREDALWNRAALEACAGKPAGRLTRIVVAVDPPASSGARADACGIVAVGLDEAGRAVVLEDATLNRASPNAWAARAIGLYHSLEADCVVAEINQGGEIVATVLRSIDPTVPVKSVRASRGKWLRAEPVAALYEQGRVRHARRLPELEDEMCDFGPDGLSDGRSPDRLDALVWAVTELMLSARAAPRVRDL